MARQGATCRQQPKHGVPCSVAAEYWQTTGGAGAGERCHGPCEQAEGQAAVPESVGAIRQHHRNQFCRARGPYRVVKRRGFRPRLRQKAIMPLYLMHQVRRVRRLPRHMMSSRPGQRVRRCRSSKRCSLLARLGPFVHRQLGLTILSSSPRVLPRALRLLNCVCFLSRQRFGDGRHVRMGDGGAAFLAVIRNVDALVGPVRFSLKLALGLVLLALG